MNTTNNNQAFASEKPETIGTDVVIVGASIAGTTAATLFARQGLRVLLVDRATDAAHYKKQCSHFIQAEAAPVLDELGVVDAMMAAGAVRNGLRMWTEAGWFDGSHPTKRGYTLRRQKLDPILRDNAVRTPGVELRLGLEAEGLVEEAGRVVGVRLKDASGAVSEVRAKLVVGADGRHSKIAALSGIEADVRPHNRGGFMAYYAGVKMKTGTDSQFWIEGEDVTYAFPTDDGDVLLAVMTHEKNLDAARADRDAFIAERFARLADAPDLTHAERRGQFVAVAHTPNTYRHPTKPGLALVGDAAMASDYIWGVGCGWALLGARMLARHVGPALVADAAPAVVEAALATFAKQHKDELHSQHVQNTAFSATDKLPALQRLLFTHAVHDEKLRVLMQKSVAGEIGKRDLRVPLRLIVAVVRAKLGLHAAKPARALTPAPAT